MNAAPADALVSLDRGFLVRTLQFPMPPGVAGTAAAIPADLAWTESMLGGALGNLISHPLIFATNNFYLEAGIINYSAPLPFVEEIFLGPRAGDATFPGLPSFGSSSYDNTAIEVITYLKFDAPGTYRFSLHTGDIFKVAVGHAPAPALVSVLSPDAIAGPLAAVPSVRDDPQAIGIFGRLPPQNFEANLVPVIGTAPDTTELQGCGESLSNAPELAGQIALVDRGGCSFVEKVRNAAAAGAFAVLVVNDRPDPPIIMGGLPNELAPPACMIRQSDGLRLKSIPGARLRLSAAPANVVALKTTPSDPENTTFTLRIGSPGFYPLRLITQVLSSPATLEWTVSTEDSGSFLLNDPAQAQDGRSPVEAYATAPNLPEPAIRLHHEATGYVVQYVGVLQSAVDPDGPFVDEPGAPISGSAPIANLAGRGFFRARW
ncbi:MAG: hypothetical protein IT581_08180 [Verrucomicrobiales bacterium]|nr:hypothetical protein [Verrucomicrobiales bacterium]